MSADRMTEELDWKDGMNAFRLRIRQEIIELKEEINKIKQQIKGEPQ